MKKPENTVFVLQVVVIFIVVIGAVVNLTVGTENVQLWTTVLIACMAYLIPNPKVIINPELLKDKKEFVFPQ